MTEKSNNKENTSGKIFKILSIDGGGFRGVFSAHILSQMEEKWSINWVETFDMIAGTSTGSIIAAGLGSGLSATDLFDFYKKYGEFIFTPRYLSILDFLKIFTSRYSKFKLSKCLEEKFKSKTLGDIPIPLIIPSVDIGVGCVHVFKSKYADGFVRDPNVKVADAVLASCSAPTYFDPHIIDGKYQLVDGGLWANNPSLVAVIDARYRLGIPLENIRVISVGTGKSKTFYPQKTNWWWDWFIRSWQGWGFTTRWGRSKLIDLILNLQADTAHNMLCLLLGEDPREPKSVCRLTFESDIHLPMDSARKLNDWVNQADHCFTHNSGNIKKILDL